MEKGSTYAIPAFLFMIALTMPMQAETQTQIEDPWDIRLMPYFWMPSLDAEGTVGYQVGLSGKSVLKVSIVLALIFSSVVFLIADLDRAIEGRLRVSQQPMFQLQKKIQASQAVILNKKSAASTVNRWENNKSKPFPLALRRIKELHTNKQNKRRFV